MQCVYSLLHRSFILKQRNEVCDYFAANCIFYCIFKNILFVFLHSKSLSKFSNVSKNHNFNAIKNLLGNIRLHLFLKYRPFIKINMGRQLTSIILMTMRTLAHVFSFQIPARDSNNFISDRHVTYQKQQAIFVICTFLKFLYNSK